MSTIPYSEQFTADELDEVRAVAEWGVVELAAVMVGGSSELPELADQLARLSIASRITDVLGAPGFPPPAMYDLTGKELATLRALAEDLIQGWGPDPWEPNLHEPEARPFYAERIMTCRRALAALDRIGVA